MAIYMLSLFIMAANKFTHEIVKFDTLEQEIKEWITNVPHLQMQIHRKLSHHFNTHITIF